MLTRENTDIDGNLTVDAGQTLAWGDNTIRYTFTPNDTTNYKVVKGEVTVSVVDTIPPEEIEACRRICEDEIGAIYRVREYIED